MKISKFAKFMLAGALVLGAFGLKEAATPQKAEAADSYHSCYSSVVGCASLGLTFRTDVNTYVIGASTYVGVTLTNSVPATLYNWDMYFEKKNMYGTWVVHGAAVEKYGYVHIDSPSSRTWSINDFSPGSYRAVLDIRTDFDGDPSEYVGEYYQYVTPFTVK